MEKITYESNEKTLDTLKKGYDNMWDLFFYGDKKSNTKPGDIRVYGAIAGQRQVAMNRLLLREELTKENEEEKQ